ncbi:MAG: FAD-dependent oxidoreductase [Verrucomicrobia bacterium]|nr:FAD-dependent oxidoreductase [Verrucomicrobiota bacterium]
MGLALALAFGPAPAARAAHVLVEAEHFTDHGGWSLDTQFIELMGSPYLLAHGLGQPVPDATTTVTLPRPGAYRVWVRTKDWVARWRAPGAPGRFEVRINGQALPETFGTVGAEWFWQPGGTVEVHQARITLALHDLTGFDGRCDAVLLTDDPQFEPPNDAAPVPEWRQRLRGLPEAPREAGAFDLVVVGGGYAGMCAAVSAARMGCRVALLQDRPVLGGNGSSEVRVWPQGLTRRGRYPRLGEIVEELADRPSQSPGSSAEFKDARREAVLRAEKNLALFLNHHVFRAETNEGRIVAVLALDTRTGEVRRFGGALFADCTGHGTLGALAGADQRVQGEGHMGMSNMWRWNLADEPVAFPAVPWALRLGMKDFPYPRKGHGEWFWESGFDRHPIDDLEHTRDWNLRAVFGAFDAMKNGAGREEHRRARLEWVAYVGGTRESRQLLGDVILTRDDIAAKRDFPDGCVPTTWSIDLHYPDARYTNAYPQDPFISRAVFDRAVDSVHGYPVPYRCFYSRNLDNLFMAGRCISVTHEALGTVRVMKTGGMMGEVVGKAASLCIKYQRLPRAIHHSHLDELKDLMRQPGAARRNTVHDPLSIPEGVPPLPAPEVIALDPGRLPGIVIDDPQATFTGRWQPGQNLRGFVGERYWYHAPGGSGSARFVFRVPAEGRYEVRLAYQDHPNRASNVPVTVTSAEGDRQVTVNQKLPPPLNDAFVAVGTFRFEAGQPGGVRIETRGVNGIVHADAVQVVPAP